ncbi:MAG: ABC transporter ATP-binding protein [Christensenellaceae bacterium]
MSVLVCKNVFKSYDGKNNVLDGFNLEIPEGKIFGLLGPNGCGKSTLIKIVAGLLTGEWGEITVAGEPLSEKTNALISYLPERPYFNPRMSVNQLIDYFCDFYTDFDRERALKMLSELGIDSKAVLKTLSKGTKEKVQLIMTMSRRAKLYMLDEPIGGVDPAARDYILRTIVSNYSPDSSIIITTHLIYDVEPVLDEFAFMAPGGKILLSGNADEAREKNNKTLNEIFKEVFRYV